LTEKYGTFEIEFQALFEHRVSDIVPIWEIDEPISCNVHDRIHD